MKNDIDLAGMPVSSTAGAQDDWGKIERACPDYLEGFYEGDSSKLIRSISPGCISTVTGRIRIPGSTNQTGR